MPAHENNSMIRQQRAMLNRRVGYWRSAKGDYISLWTEEEKHREVS